MGLGLCHLARHHVVDGQVARRGGVPERRRVLVIDDDAERLREIVRRGGGVPSDRPSAAP
jgi:hypothetical protein